MRTVGAYEAKTHFSKLLAEVARGEQITIEKHGVPVAVLQPVQAKATRPLAEVIAEMRAFQQQHSLAGMTARELIEEGRM